MERKEAQTSKRKIIFQIFVRLHFCPTAVICKQDDQIGRFFDYGAIVYFGWFSENYKSNWAIFDSVKSYVLVLTRNGLGCFLGDLFISSSGHPVCKYVVCSFVCNYVHCCPSTSKPLSD
jgi:hypothetical protein